MNNKNYIVECNGEAVTHLSFEGTKANVTTGDALNAIWYTSDEAIECAAAIGTGARPVCKSMTASEVEDAIRDRVEMEMPAPVGGFESDDARDAHQAAQDARFLELCNLPNETVKIPMQGNISPVS